MYWQKVLCSLFYIVALAVTVYYCVRYSKPVKNETDHSYLLLCKQARIFLIFWSILAIFALLFVYCNEEAAYILSFAGSLTMVLFSALSVECYTNCETDGFYYQNLFTKERWVSFDTMTVEKHKGMYQPKKLFPPPAVDQGKQHYEIMLETIYQRQKLK